MSSDFRHVAGMSVATSMVLGGAASAFARGVNRARAYQEACDANAIREDEIGAFRKLMSAFRKERVRAETAEARVCELEAELANVRLERLRLLRRLQ